MFDIIEHLQIRPELKQSILSFREQYPVEEQLQSRIPVPDNIYYGTDIWEKAVTALLCGKNILLVGHKATGKNIFAENLAAAFGRPRWDVSFHVNMDAASLIGMDTFKNQEVVCRPGPICCAAQNGGFAVLDEINMAKSEALAVLHGTLDFRRSIDVPGYERIELHPATRFIATMNYGYAGTKELNEALVSRFLVIQMPDQNEETLEKIFTTSFPEGKPEAIEQFIGLFLDLQKKAENGEISTKALDLRGILASLRAIRQGLKPSLAVRMGVINKCFDGFEKEIVEDVVMTRIPEEWTAAQVF